MDDAHSTRPKRSLRQADERLHRDEAIRIARERYGLRSDGVDHNIHRVVKLARRSLGGVVAAFAIPVRGGELSYVVTDGFQAVEDTRTTEGCRQVLATGSPISLESVDASFSMNCASLREIPIRAFVGLPVLSHEKRVIGVLAVMFTHARAIAPDDMDVLNDHVRLIEDSLLLRMLNIRDPLTQLFNRRYLEQQARNEWRRAMRLQIPLSIAIKDVDHFKRYNDECGHQKGDDVLVKLGQLMDATYRRAGDSVCRYGGEEFAVIMPMTSKVDALRISESFLQDIRDLAIPHPAVNSIVTMSVGLTTFETVEQLEQHDLSEGFTQADRALYLAKAKGRNMVQHFDDVEP